MSSGCKTTSRLFPRRSPRKKIEVVGGIYDLATGKMNLPFDDGAASMEDTLERWRSEKTAAFLPRRCRLRFESDKKPGLFKQMAEPPKSKPTYLPRISSPSRNSRRHSAPKLIASLPPFGPRAMRPILSASKVRGISVYRRQDRSPTDIPGPHPLRKLASAIAVFGGGTLRAGVFGANDGLVSNTCLVMGVAGAAVEPRRHRPAGVAGLLAGAFSMAAGEFISMLSQPRDVRAPDRAGSRGAQALPRRKRPRSSR